MKKFIVAALLTALWGQAIAVPAAQSNWRSVAEQLTAGTQIVVRLSDGSQVKGTFVGIAGDSLEVSPRTRYPVPPRQVSFDSITSIESKKSGMNPAVKFLTIAGIVGGGSILLFYLAALTSGQ